MSDHKLLEKLIDDIVEALRKRDRLVFDEEYDHPLGPPSSPQQMARLERILGKPLPPSYRAFQELHNGWDKLVGGAKLLAVEDHDSQWVKSKIKFWSDLWDPDENGDDPFEKGAMPILFGEDNNSFLVLDPTTVQPNGEMDFVMYDYMEEEERFKDFTSFLRKKLKLLEEMIDDEEKGVPDEE